MTHQESTKPNNSHQNQVQNQNPGSRHTRSSSIASNRPSIRVQGHGRTPSTDHLMVPERLDTLPQRKRKESLDTLRNQPISHHTPPIAHRHHHQPSKPTVSREIKTPIPRHRDLPPTLLQQQSKNEVKSDPKGRDRNIKTPKPLPKDLPPESREERHDRVRKLSSREVLYPTPEAAKEAFRVERAMNPPPKHRRPPTPYTSSRRTSSVRKVDSDRSIRSRVSFDSTRSRRSNRSDRSGRTYDSDSESDGTMGSKWEPSFGSNVGIGPAGEAIEVIGLGRKKPRHRTFTAGMLKPALRSTSRMNSRVDINEGSSNSNSNSRREKPLPSRPMSYVAPIVNSLSKVTAPGGRKIQKRSSHQPTPSNYSVEQNNHILGASSSVTPLSRSVSRNHTSGNENGIRSLFSSLSLGPNANPNSTSHHDVANHSGASSMNSVSDIRFTSTAPSRASRRHLILPADDLFSYLRYAEIQSWDRWPLAQVSQKRGLGLWGGKRTLGFDEMSWEWHRRLRLAEEARVSGRMLGSWESQRGWEKGILDWLDENVSKHAIDMANRWGTQIFALPAEGFDTLEFFDESINKAEDFGLLSWVTGTLLQTAVSTLHMLRYSSSTFTFHLIPSPRPPHLQHSSSSLHVHDSPSSRGKFHFLWEGFGTMVLVNKNNDIDRAMILEIRPPSVVDSSVMKEFARGMSGEGWWGFYGDTCVGEVGQANLLQAQVYDDCIQNQVHFFAVTNLKYWVFGQFNSNWSRCTVSPVISRGARDPSLMQCLTAWVVRSVDERPRASESHTMISPQLPTLPQENEREHRRHRRSQSRPSDIPSYTDTVRSRRSNSRSSFSLPPNAQGYDYSPTPYPQPTMGLTPVYPISTPNGTQTVFPVNMNVPPNEYNTNGYGSLPAYSDIPQSNMSPSPYNQPAPGGMVFPQWNGMNGTSRAFSPVPQQGGTPMPYNFGNSWYGGGGGMFPWAGMR
ncbi:hypothetical protein I302_108203 [Kwoniella bestiolae CBS 10118]|uniref:Uncharacterized protein n=1 Tax=Kwoniella bestiolae CBS 10118 TaxID=1296100 RepID=A0A1B9FWF1_9TREE|nr:hypothetical protein I302_07432 [Kwoniella bestiolae CBS 10118]OCF23081.1 hypothetical protein I302_07432 [Kwoniella bestiolae CBS 10118]